MARRRVATPSPPLGVAFFFACFFIVFFNRASPRGALSRGAVRERACLGLRRLAFLPHAVLHLGGTDLLKGQARRLVVFARHAGGGAAVDLMRALGGDRKSTRLNSSHSQISYAVFCL